MPVPTRRAALSRPRCTTLRRASRSSRTSSRTRDIMEAHVSASNAAMSCSNNLVKMVLRKLSAMFSMAAARGSG